MRVVARPHQRAALDVLEAQLVAEALEIGEFGGGEWAIQQTGGVDNILDYMDGKLTRAINPDALTKRKSRLIKPR